MKRTITGRAAGRFMTLGELRQFVSSIENLPDEVPVKARASFRRRLRAVTIEDDDAGFRAYVRAVSGDDDDDEAGRGSRRRSSGIDSSS